ncbi:MAG: 16S rRNA (uracil1498-N3)-methyltransferase [Verrucomicrobiales bacterium]|jgi:16S rRNA (uracil1498-N3)-methyltransferase
MSSRNRFFIPAEAWRGDEGSLSGDEAKHCARVFRHRVGDEIEVFSGLGEFSVARIVGIESRSVWIERLSSERQAACPPITLAASLLRGKNFETIIQKACEIGVREIVPLETDNCVARVDSREVSKKLLKWKRVAIEACKQSGLTFLPEIREPRSLTSFADGDGADLKLVAALSDRSRSLREIIDGENSVSVAIGPEGDFSPAELEFLRERGYAELDLGATTLRAETAAIHALSILVYELATRTATG